MRAEIQTLSFSYCTALLNTVLQKAILLVYKLCNSVVSNSRISSDKATVRSFLPFGTFDIDHHSLGINVTDFHIHYFTYP